MCIIINDTVKVKLTSYLTVLYLTLQYFHSVMFITEEVQGQRLNPFLCYFRCSQDTSVQRWCQFLEKLTKGCDFHLCDMSIASSVLHVLCFRRCSTDGAHHASSYKWGLPTFCVVYCLLLAVHAGLVNSGLHYLLGAITPRAH